MAIVFGGDAGVREDHYTNFVSEITQGISNLGKSIADNFTRLTGPPAGLNRIPEKENVFVDDGFTNVPGTAFLGSSISGIDDIQTRRHITQEPILTVYIKKKPFWSLRSEHDTRFMDSSDKLLLRATKLLFERKCGQIAAYEALTKASGLVSEEVDLDSNRIRQLLEILEEGQVFDSLAQDFNNAISTDPNNAQFLIELDNIFTQEVGNLQRRLDTLRKAASNLEELSEINDKLRHATQTTWVVDPRDRDVASTGRGSGVIELTMVSDVNTSLSIDGNSSISFSVQDPYNLMKITNDDIELSISAAFSERESIEGLLEDGFSLDEITAGLNRGPAQILDEARRKDEELKRIRRDRAANSFGIGSAGPINTNEFPEIVFEINASSYNLESGAGRLVTGTITSLPGQTFDENNFRIVIGQLPALQQLTREEDNLVKQIFDLLNEYVTTIQTYNARRRDINGNEDVKYTRRQMRKFYLGKSMIQPMDGINVYLRSKTFKDGELVGPLDALLRGSNFVQQFAQSRDVSDDVIEEEISQFGLDDIGISTDLYRILRTSSFLRNAGFHVFGGLISSVTENYSQGVYTLNVSGSSNMKWLSMSRVNVRPSLDQAEGSLEDPLTPYKFVIEEGTGLIAGKELLEANVERVDSDVLNFDITSSRNGQKVRNENLIQDYSDNEDGTAQEIEQHAPGLVYRWKEGIVAVTRDVNLKRPLDGRDDPNDKLARDYGVTVVTGSQESGPFANLDAADIISLLVTGVPHNFESFFENAKSVGVFTPGTNNSSEGYFNSFFDIQRSIRKSLGNFQPYKVINITQENLHERVRIQGFLRDTGREVSGLRSELASLENQLAGLSGERFKTNEISEETEADRQRAENSLRSAISIVRDRINQKIGEFKEAGKRGENLGLRLYGSDPTNTIVDATTAPSDEESRQELNRSVRLRNTLLQVRPQAQCKFNTDNNLLIIGDEYDKDLDIQAFVLESLSSQQPPLWESGYKTPFEICQNVAKTLDFEFFCNTQGHIEFRPPRYNKIPLSLLLRVFIIDRQENRQLYPEFLRAIFGIRSQGFRDRLNTLDIQIKINLLKLNAESGQLVNILEENISSETDNPSLFSLEPIGFTEGGVTVEQSRVEQIISLTNQLRAIQGGESVDTVEGQSEDISADSSEFKKIEEEVRRLNDTSSPNFSSIRLTLQNKTAQLISQRQQLAETVEKIESQEDKLNSESTRRLPTNMKQEERERFLEPYKDLIQDDFNDFLGPGSSKRYIIYDDEIISSNFTESDDNVEFTRVDVTGEEDLLGDGPGNLGGVPVLWAGATDFDLWRQYGWRSMGSVNKPFFKDAETQCAPYALMLLSRQRRNVVRGTITIYGNEYYQLGDVVYINSRDMLYYVTRVDHSFNYESGNFTTTLQLNYGHPLGDYIPTPLDIIGKVLIKNQRSFNRSRTNRRTASKVVHLGYVIFDNNTTGEEGSSGTGAPGENAETKNMLNGQYALENVTQLKNALLKAVPHVGPDEPDVLPKVEIRGYITEDSEEAKQKVIKRMRAMRKWFTEPKGRYIPSRDTFIVLDKRSILDNALGKNQIREISTENDPINVVTPNEFNVKSSRYPREEVFNITSSTVTLDNIVEAVLVLRD